MSNGSIEHLDPDTIEWKKIYEGVFERVLRKDDETRACTRLVRFEPGSRLNSILEHEFYEEFLVIDGALIDSTLQKTYTRGMYAYRPPGLKHGPFMSPEGCLAVEIRYFGRH